MPKNGGMNMENNNSIEPIVTIKNTGKHSRLSVLGIDISRAVSELEYRSHSITKVGRDKELSGSVTVTLNLDILTSILVSLTESDLNDIKNILEPYHKIE
ncbi:MAG: hypothetical protein K0R78_2669 [Pelosinus sp.]|jgi:hypothetical protein|nr:hypothetical protein [Pelosinus sp.]